MSQGLRYLVPFLSLGTTFPKGGLEFINPTPTNGRSFKRDFVTNSLPVLFSEICPILEKIDKFIAYYK